MAKDTDGFARDLGYLDAFFDKLDAQGGAMGGASGARLRAFVGEERRRWSEIRALLAGADKTSVSSPVPAAVTTSDVAPSLGKSTSAAEPAPRFTVGSLRSMSDRGKLL